VGSNPPAPTKDFNDLVDGRRRRGVRLAIRGMATLWLSLAAANGVAGTDPKADLANETHAAMAQLQASWKGTRADLADRDQSALATRRHLAQTVASLGLKRIEPCPASRLPPSEGEILARYAAMELDFSTQQEQEFERLDQLKTQYHEGYLAGAAEDVQAKLWRQLAWSQARLKMIDDLHAVFRADYALRRTTAENGCTIRQILAVKDGVPEDLKSELSRTLSDIDDSAHEATASTDGRYRDALGRIAAMP
jgi:hypothetical protein